MMFLCEARVVIDNVDVVSKLNFTFVACTTSYRIDGRW